MQKAERTARHNFEQPLLPNQGEKQLIRMRLFPGFLDIKPQLLSRDHLKGKGKQHSRWTVVSGDQPCSSASPVTCLPSLWSPTQTSGWPLGWEAGRCFCPSSKGQQPRGLKPSQGAARAPASVSPCSSGCCFNPQKLISC